MNRKWEHKLTKLIHHTKCYYGKDHYYFIKDLISVFNHIPIHLGNKGGSEENEVIFVSETFVVVTVFPGMKYWRKKKLNIIDKKQLLDFFNFFLFFYQDQLRFK